MFEYWPIAHHDTTTDRHEGIAMPGKELQFSNGTITDEPRIRLACTRCRAWREYDEDGETVVRCTECGKRHSRNSLHDTAVAGVLS